MSRYFYYFFRILAFQDLTPITTFNIIHIIPFSEGNYMRRKENRKPLPRKQGWRDISDEFWETIKKFIPKPKKRKIKKGRPSAEPRKILGCGNTALRNMMN